MRRIESLKYMLAGCLLIVLVMLLGIGALAAWYRSPLVVDLDCSRAVMVWGLLLPFCGGAFVAAKIGCRVMKCSFLLGLFSWCLLFGMAVFFLPGFFSATELGVTLAAFLFVAVAAGLCCLNIRNLRAARRPEPDIEPDIEQDTEAGAEPA